MLLLLSVTNKKTKCPKCPCPMSRGFGNFNGLKAAVSQILCTFAPRN